MTIDTIIKNNISILRLNGKLNIETVIKFDETVHELIINDETQIIAVDCKNLQYVDSSGLGSWIQYLNMSKGINKDFYLFDLPDNILIIIEMAFLEKFFKCTTSIKLNADYETDIF